MICQFPEAFQTAVLGSQGYTLAPRRCHANGVAVPAEGGFRLSGRWQWGTGITHADWVIVGARATSDGGLPAFRFLALPRDEVKVEDVWFVDGMSGTGSNDIVIEDAVVPERAHVSIADLSAGCAHGARLHEGPLYRTPMLPILASTRRDARRRPGAGRVRGLPAAHAAEDAARGRA